MDPLRKILAERWRAAAPKPFDPADPVVKLHEPTYDDEEIAAVAECLLGVEVTMGPRVRAFEDAFAARFGHGHAAMVNSGSSANLLAVSALSNPAVPGHLRPGDEVIVPALCWSTTVWPLVQHGLVPVIVDIDPETLDIDVAAARAACRKETRAIMPVHIYGNPCDMDALDRLAKERELTVVEDACESLGAAYLDRPVGSFGRVGTFSFYFSHHITTLEGGMVVTSDDAVAEALRVLRAHGWVREMRDGRRHVEENPEIDPKFLFINLGYNLRATEPQGAMGSIQLGKLDGFVRIRSDNAEFWRRELADLGDRFGFQKTTNGGTHSWFGFPMWVKPGAPFSARDVMAFMRARGIEMRPLNAGNIAAQPGMRRFPRRVAGDLPRATAVMRDGFTWGNHQHVDARARTYVAESLRAFVKERA